MSASSPILSRVLVAEDNPLMVAHLRLMLEDMGVGLVRTAATGAEAFEAIKNARPSLAIVDIQLGRDNGLKVADKCSTDGVPVILSTGYGEIFRSILSTEILLQKPYTAADLQTAISKLNVRASLV